MDFPDPKLKSPPDALALSRQVELGTPKVHQHKHFIGMISLPYGASLGDVYGISLSFFLLMCFFWALWKANAIHCPPLLQAGSFPGVIESLDSACVMTITATLVPIDDCRYHYHEQFCSIVLENTTMQFYSVYSELFLNWPR